MIYVCLFSVAAQPIARVLWAVHNHCDNSANHVEAERLQALYIPVERDTMLWACCIAFVQIQKLGLKYG